MIPLKNTVPKSKKAKVNRLLVAFTILVFLVQATSGKLAYVLVQVFGFVPARFFQPAAFDYTFLEAAITLVTSLFLHGGLVHVAGNLVYLWVFGDDVESHMGGSRYLLFYIAGGAFGSLSHAILFPASVVPSVGASGSIAAVLGAFLVAHWRARIVTLVPLVVSWAMLEIPALVFLPVWFLLQFLNGWLALASAANTQQVAGIAWWAHIGGFLFGAVVGLAMKKEGVAAPAATAAPRKGE